ncbi:gp436 family protein [Pseudogemmobacter blasticus]|uniref:gp436 family protein n=1 Tax=Fuscovulum blasticum TaxID=1075 RepID=UPI0015E7ACCD|nr:DUF1320 domain-containing protein [Fuscovulum blasticum]
MTYATRTDITDLYGVNALVVADHDRVGVPDDAAITRALVMASGEIDTYLARRYTLPLTVTPAHLVQLCVDIALYRMALSQDVASEEHRKRYEDAISVLTKMADGRVSLVLPPVEGSEDETPAVTGAQPIVAGGPPRLFSRDKMREF